MSELPLKFLYDLDDRGLKRLVKAVWQRLPAYDRSVLRELVSSIQVDVSEGEYVLGSTSLAFSEIPHEGWQVPENSESVVNLTGTMKVRSDAACMYVIAHEFAHVILRHSTLGATLASLLAFEPPIYTTQEIEHLREWKEEHAALQAFVWGFKDEVAAFYKEYPESRLPKWYLYVEGEG